VLPRSSALKLARAHAHVDDLRAKIARANGGKHPAIEFVREYEPDDHAIVFKAKSLPQIPEDAGVLVGDAIHNYRCALDHLWWQLALDHLGREPSEKEARSIQFPIIDPSANWATSRFLEHVERKAADHAKTFQLDHGRDELHILNYLSNRDKHRLIQPTFYVPQGMMFRQPPISAYRDCLPPAANDEFGFMRMVEFRTATPDIGQEAMRINITPTGPNPDLDFDPEFTGDIAVGRNWRMEWILQRIGETVDEIITSAAPFLK
jgi:hypothetical protein